MSTLYGFFYFTKGRDSISTFKVYEVKSITGGYALRVVAKDSTQAKRKYCRKTGRRPSDPFTGITNLTAKKIN